MDQAEPESVVPDPWDALNARHHGSDPFALFVEQFEQIAELLDASTVAKDRMALVALDNLAEVILHRHSQSVFRADRQPSWRSWQRFSEKDYARVADQFSQKVSLAQGEHGESIFKVMPILDASDGAVFLTAHTYRNRVYHEGRHNAALLPILTRAYMAALARTFVRSTPVNVGSSNFPIPLDVLKGYGYEPEESSWHSFFDPGKAAQAIATHFAPAYEIDFDAAATALAADLTERAGSSGEMLRWLIREGMQPDRLSFALRWSDFWDQYGADDELVRLDGERRRLYDAAHDGGDDARTAADDANVSWEQRFRDLQRKFEPRVDLKTLERVDALARRLTNAKTVAALVERYHNLDRELEVVEAAVDQAAIGWDRFIQQEVDRARGK